MNNKGEGVFEAIVILGIIGLLISLIIGGIKTSAKTTFEAANAKGYIIVNDLFKYSVKLIETRKSTDDSWVPVKCEK